MPFSLSAVVAAPMMIVSASVMAAVRHRALSIMHLLELRLLLGIQYLRDLLLHLDVNLIEASLLLFIRKIRGVQATDLLLGPLCDGGDAFALVQIEPQFL